MKLIPASELPKPENSSKMDKAVNRFLDSTVAEAIHKANKQGKKYVNVTVPTFAYDDLPSFYNIVKAKLLEFGYVANESHDGAGMYSTLEVKWT